MSNALQMKFDVANRHIDYLYSKLQEEVIESITEWKNRHALEGTHDWEVKFYRNFLDEIKNAQANYNKCLDLIDEEENKKCHTV